MGDDVREAVLALFAVPRYLVKQLLS